MVKEKSCLVVKFGVSKQGSINYPIFINEEEGMKVGGEVDLEKVKGVLF